MKSIDDYDDDDFGRSILKLLISIFTYSKIILISIYFLNAIESTKLKKYNYFIKQSENRLIIYITN